MHWTDLRVDAPRGGVDACLRRLREAAVEDRSFPAEAARIVRETLRLDAVTILERGEQVRSVASAGATLSVPPAVLGEAADGPKVGLTADGVAVVPLVRLSAALLAAKADAASLEDLSEVAAAVEAGWTLNATLRLYDSAADLLDRAAGWTSDDPDGLLHELAAATCELLDCDRASIFVHDATRGELVGAPAIGIEDGTLRLPEDAGLVGQVVRTGRPVRIDDPYEDDRFDPSTDEKTGYRTESILCCPMISADAVVGAVQAINKRIGPFTAADGQLLELLASQAAAALARAKDRQRVERKAKLLAERAGGTDVVGDSPAMTKVRETIGRLAQTDLPVLILGESGTGKEVCASALHENGPRASAPFVAVNCAAIAETLLESELFGHERGAFTDARETRAGKFELASGGTLLLDEIGDMSPGGQAKLLRVLEQKVVTRVGGSQAIPVDVRVVAATNAKLADKVGRGDFREDLYYRLSVVTLELPPLRDRVDDILPLAEFFLGQFAAAAGRGTMTLAKDARQRLTAHLWPGNVRELRNLMERVAYLSAEPTVRAEDVAFILSPTREGDGSSGVAGDLPLSEATAEFQRLHIESAFRRARGSATAAAELLGVHRSNLYRKMKQLEMDVPG